MTKSSKALTIVLTVFSILFMGVAAVMSTVRTDWKEKATKEFPKSRIAEQKEKIDSLDKETASLERQKKDADAAIQADVQAFLAPQNGREAQLETELEGLVKQIRELAGQIETEAKKVQLKQDEDKRLREEVIRLRAQYDDLVSQKYDIQETVKRQRDLLFQARGVLERVTHRLNLLKADGAGEKSYDGELEPAGKDTAKPESEPSAARPANTRK
jgi:chromosome segregation ATPase